MFFRYFLSSIGPWYEFTFYTIVQKRSAIFPGSMYVIFFISSLLLNSRTGQYGGCTAPFSNTSFFIIPTRIFNWKPWCIQSKKPCNLRNHNFAEGDQNQKGGTSPIPGCPDGYRHTIRLGRLSGRRDDCLIERIPPMEDGRWPWGFPVLLIGRVL